MPAPIAKRSDRSDGRVKGQPQRFVNGHGNRGRVRSAEWLANMAEAQRGKTRSLESRRKQAASLRAKRRRGPASPAWKGGRKKQHGYVKVWVGVEHPMSDHHGYVLEHRLVMADHLGRMLTREEVVHHVNEVRDDNRIENLMLFATEAEHRAHHLALRRAAA